VKNLKNELKKIIKTVKKDKLIIFLMYLRKKIFNVVIVDITFTFYKNILCIKVEEINEFGDYIEWYYCYNDEEIIKNIFRYILIYYNYFTKNDFNKLTWLFYNKNIYVKDEVIKFIKNFIKSSKIIELLFLI